MSKSSTAKILAGNSNTSYSDGQLVEFGVNVQDTVALGGVTLKNVQFGNVRTASTQQSLGFQALPCGVMGISFEIAESQVAHWVAKPYTNLAAALKDQGLTKSIGYSMYLNSPGPFRSSLIFCTLTHAQHSRLLTLPIFTKPQIQAPSSLAELIPRNILATSSRSLRRRI